MAMLRFEPGDMPQRELYDLVTSLVVPRPIAWVSTVDSEDVPNLAPYSYFNLCSASPPIIHLTSTGTKDSVRNIESSGEFVVNIVDEELLNQMNVTAVSFPEGDDEFLRAGLRSEPAIKVRPPRVALSRVAMECTVRMILEVGEGRMVFGDVVLISVSDSVWNGRRADAALLKPVGRLGGSNYLTTDGVRHLRRLTPGEFR